MRLWLAVVFLVVAGSVGVPPVHGAVTTYYIAPDGDNANPGTRDKPLRTIGRAVALVRPGDTVRLLGGTYHESVTVERSGRADAYITLEADTKTPAAGRDRAGGPKLVGYQRGPRTWRRAGEGIFSTVEKQTVGTVTLGGRRIYHHASLEALKSARAPLDKGWWQDRKGGRVYVRLDRDEPPRGEAVRMGVLPFGLRLRGCGYWIVKGLHFECFGGGRYSRGLEIDAGHHVVVRNCTFETMRTGISIRRKESHHCLIERNTIRDSGIWGWPWKACKSHDVEGAGISVRGGGGNVVRFNDITGPFNGIIASLWGDLENEAFNRDVDVHDNRFALIGDDPLEPEGACMNMRFWRNQTTDTLMGISLAPITVGPVYVVRDRYLNYKAGAVKVSVSSRGPVFLYHLAGWIDRPKQNAMSVCGPWDNMHFRNCILRGTRYVVEDSQKHPVGCSFDYCCLHSTASQFVKWSNRRYGDLETLTKLPTFGAHLLRVEPYTKRAGRSPSGLEPKLIDAGIHIPGINDDFHGKAPDIGPDEAG